MTDLVPVTENEISPEGLEVANSYLVTRDITLTAQSLNLPREYVASYLEDPLVKKYITAVYLDTGYRNRFTLGEALDEIIAKKMEEMEEAEITSSKDIADLLKQAHEMRKDELRLLIELEKVQKASVVNTGPTVNIQDNSLSGSNYGQLMQQLLGLDHEKKT